MRAILKLSSVVVTIVISSVFVCKVAWVLLMPYNLMQHFSQTLVITANVAPLLVDSISYKLRKKKNSAIADQKLQPS